ncbi:hypothetical protein BDQ17DRAFT_1422614 [Cyathus striatus]|nr:hypothetical protein BDQ17DRAFT_1422614 [Cyathus striatus]
MSDQDKDQQNNFDIPTQFTEMDINSVINSASSINTPYQSSKTRKRACTNTQGSDLSPTSTPAKKCVQMSTVYVSPDREKIWEALKSGGLVANLQTQSTKNIVEQIQFYVIPDISLTELLTDSALKSFVLSDPHPGVLSIDHLEVLGIGACKTAHKGQLTITPLAKLGLSYILNQAVAVKCIYYPGDLKGKKKSRSDSQPSFSIGHFAVDSELEKTLVEANVFYWAASLLSHTYLYISQVGVAIVHNSTATKSGGKTMTMQRVYLVEELIEDDRGNTEFIKFIHNGSAKPLLAEVDPLYSTAEFLSFTQHVQYNKTGGLVYISDLQGSSTLLFDPQIMTALLLEDKANLFGGGNIGSVFDKFSLEHTCNRYCHWFNLDELNLDITHSIPVVESDA